MMEEVGMENIIHDRLYPDLDRELCYDSREKIYIGLKNLVNLAEVVDEAQKQLSKAKDE